MDDGKKTCEQVNEFEKYTLLAVYVHEMAITGNAPYDWSDFIAALNHALVNAKQKPR